MRVTILLAVPLISLAGGYLLKAFRVFHEMETDSFLAATLFSCLSLWSVLVSSVLFYSPGAFDLSPGLATLAATGAITFGLGGYLFGWGVGGRWRQHLGVLCFLFLTFAYVPSMSFLLNSVDLNVAKQEVFWGKRKLSIWDGKELSPAEFAQRVRRLEERRPSSQ